MGFRKRWPPAEAARVCARRGRRPPCDRARIRERIGRNDDQVDAVCNVAANRELIIRASAFSANALAVSGRSRASPRPRRRGRSHEIRSSTTVGVNSATDVFKQQSEWRRTMDSANDGPRRGERSLTHQLKAKNRQRPGGPGALSLSLACAGAAQRPAAQPRPRVGGEPHDALLVLAQLCGAIPGCGRRPYPLDYEPHGVSRLPRTAVSRDRLSEPQVGY